MPQKDVKPSAALQAFRAASLQATEAFNRQDFDTAFLALPEDIEWEPLKRIPGARLLRGKEAVIEWFRQVAADFPDFRSEQLEFTEIGPGVFMVEFENRATGRASGVAVAGGIVQVWELARSPWRVREYGSVAEALEAVGLSAL